MPVSEFYNLDFFEWTQRNAELLRKGCFTEADVNHIAEEIADMGARDQREVRSYLIRLVLHLLKWKFQPALRSPSWMDSIDQSRVELEGIFRQSPSLKRYSLESFEEIYPKAVRQAEHQTGIPRRQFPEQCPFTFEQILDDEFLPD